MQTQAAGFMRSSFWNFVAVLMEPAVTTVARIYVYTVEARNCASRNANQRGGITAPQLSNR